MGLEKVESKNTIIRYIDFDNGSNLQDGKTRETAWKTIPGTRNKDNSNWKDTNWGDSNAYCDTNVVKGGTIFRLKRGMVYDSSKGGCIWINRTFYENTATKDNPIKFELDSNWGTGNVLFDGKGIAVDIAFILIQQNGIQIDGIFPDGIQIQNSQKIGLQVKELPGDGVPIQQFSIRKVDFFNNGTLYAGDQEGSNGQLDIRSAIDLTIDSCKINGNQNHLMGILLGEGNMAVTSAVISNCVVCKHKKGPSDDDAGIGIKALNSQVKIIDCVLFENGKGLDLGEYHGNGVEICYSVRGCICYNNKYGINANGTQDHTYPGKINILVANNLIYENNYLGSNFYDGPFDLYLVNNTYYHNGTDDMTNKEQGNLRIDVGTPTSGAVNAYIYNNIFFKPSGHCNFTTSHFFNNSTALLNIYSDYNAWVQDSGHKNEEYFCKWAFYDEKEQMLFDYNTNGPGNESNSWFLFYGNNANNIVNDQCGHYHCDGNSSGTGANNSTIPQFEDLANHDFRLKKPFKGTDISKMHWFENGKMYFFCYDKEYRKRVHWDLGAYECK